MKMGVVLPLFSGDPGRVIDSVRRAEELGFDGAFVFDHFFPPGAPRDRPALEAFSMLGALVASTERLTLGTLVTRASIRPTGLLAKTASWLDAASGGRLVLGIGTGDPIDAPEHDAYGLPMLDRPGRRAHLDETVRALKALFEGRTWPGGEHVPALEGPLLPPPARAGGPPIWLGAQAEAVIRMAGRLADGWNGWGLTPGRFREKAAVLREEAEAHGRTAEPTWAAIVLVGEDEGEVAALLERRRERGLADEAWAGIPEALVQELGDLAEAGATWAVVVPAGPSDRLELIGREVVPKVRALASPAG